MTNFNKLFTLDAETIDILKESGNQSKTVREAVKQYHKSKTNIETSKDTPQIKVRVLDG